MRLIIAGSRNHQMTLRELFNEVCAMYNHWDEPDGPAISEIVSGNSGNIDLLGEKLARVLDIPVKVFAADWKQYGPSAGPIRNHLMAAYADAALVIWDGKSKGAANMIEQANERGIPLQVVKDEE